MTRLWFAFRMFRLWLAIRVRDRANETISLLTPNTTPRPCAVEGCPNVATQHVRVLGSGRGGGRRRVVVALCSEHRIFDRRIHGAKRTPVLPDVIGPKIAS